MASEEDHSGRKRDNGRRERRGFVSKFCFYRLDAEVADLEEAVVINSNPKYTTTNGLQSSHNGNKDEDARHVRERIKGRGTRKSHEFGRKEIK